MLSNWHWKVIDPPIRTERTDSSENKIKIVRMILHIVINLSKQPPLAVKKTLENLQVGKFQHESHPSQLSLSGEDDEIRRGRGHDGVNSEVQLLNGLLSVLGAALGTLQTVQQDFNLNKIIARIFDN